MLRKYLSLLLVTVYIVAGILVVGNEISKETASLRYGSTGEQVRVMQRKLKNWGYYSGAVDGIFGSQTLAAVKWFQSKNGLVVDGIVGPKTAAKLGMSLDGGSTSTGGSGVTNSQNDVYLLAKAIHAEARGEPYRGKVAVGAVILARVKNSQFPNTIAGVIYQPGAFSSVADGQINLAPDAESLRAARDAMNGVNPVPGALYFFNPATATSKWIWSRPQVAKIGEHIFCK